MHKMSTWKSRLAQSLFLVVVLLMPATSVHALGLSPVDIIIEHVLPGSSVIEDLHISRGDAVQDDNVLVTITGDAAAYIKTPLGASFILPAGEQDFTYPITIEPGALANGTYQAKITVVTTKPTSTGTDTGTTVGSAILSGAQITVTFTVTTQTVEQYNIGEATIRSSEENQPLGFTYVMINSGNIDSRPDKIEFSAVDVLDPTYTYSETITRDKLEIIPAFSNKTVSVFTQAQLLRGSYFVKIVFYNSAGVVIFERDDMNLQIFPPGTLAQKGELVDFAADKASYKATEPIVFTGHFKNTGDIGVSAALVVDINKDGTRLDILKNEPVFIPAGQTATLDQTYKPTAGGKYIAAGYVNYGIFTTDKKDAPFSVEQLSNTTIYIFIAGLLVVIGGVMYFIYHHKRRQTKHQKR